LRKTSQWFQTHKTQPLHSIRLSLHPQPQVAVGSSQVKIKIQIIRRRMK
jgi:hypothetical protein